MSSYKKLKIKHDIALEQLQNITKKNPVPSQKIIQPSSSRISRTRTDILKWRIGLDSAESVENPLYADLQRVYNEIDLDSEITSSKTIRKNYIHAREWFVTKNGEENDEVTEYFRQRWFYDFVDGVLESQYWGYNLLQIEGLDKDVITGIKIIQRQNVNPKTNRIQATPYDNSSGDDFTDAKHINWYILCSDTENNHYTGLYNKLAQYQIQLKNAQLDYTDYINRFGSPQAVVKTRMSDENHIRNVESYLSELQNSSYAIIGEDDEIELVESSGKSSDVFAGQIAEMKSNITKTILGNDTINSEKSFVGSANIAEAQANIYSLKDLRYVEYYLNQELIPRLVNLGVGLMEGVEIRFDTTNKARPEEEFKQALELVKTGKYIIDEEWITEKFGIPVKEVSQFVEDEIAKGDNEEKEGDK